MESTMTFPKSKPLCIDPNMRAPLPSGRMTNLISFRSLELYFSKSIDRQLFNLGKVEGLIEKLKDQRGAVIANVWYKVSYSLVLSLDLIKIPKDLVASAIPEYNGVDDPIWHMKMHETSFHKKHVATTTLRCCFSEHNCTQTHLSYLHYWEP